MSIFLNLIALAAVCQIPSTVPLPNQERGLPFGAVEEYRGLMICSVVDNEGTTRRMSHETLVSNPKAGAESLAEFQFAKVLVLSSHYLRAGTIATVLYPTAGSQGKRATLPLGRHLLVLASAPKDRILSMPMVAGGEIEGHFKFRAASESEVAALAFFETSEEALPGIGDPMWQFINALASAIPKTSTENVASICRYLDSVRPLNLDPHDVTFYHLPDKLSSTFFRAVSRESAYHRALVYEAFNYRHYYGTADLYLNAVYECASDPDAFPNGVPFPSFYEDTTSNFDMAKIVHHQNVQPAKNADLILSSINPRVTVFLLEHQPKPSPDIEGRLARKLDDPNPEVRWNLVADYAKWHQDPAHAPAKPIRSTDAANRETVEYPALDTLVGYWKHQVPH